MSKKANPTLVGAFVIVGALLAVGSVIVFGSIRWFAPTATCILYFEDSVKGLDVGSAVNLRGVRIGQVKDVLIRFNQAEGDNHSPVLVEIDIKTLTGKTANTVNLSGNSFVENQVRRGLRAELGMESFVTGRLTVELDFYPPDEVPADYHQAKPVYMEIPTRTTKLTQLMKTLSQVDIVGISQKLESLLARAETTVVDLNAKELSTSLRRVLDRLDAVAAMPEIKQSLVSIRETSDEFRRLATNANAKLGPLSDEAQKTLADAAHMIEEAAKTIDGVRELLSNDAPLMQHLGETLEQLSAAAESFGQLSEYLRRNPQTVLTGRKKPGEPK